MDRRMLRLIPFALLLLLLGPRPVSAQRVPPGGFRLGLGVDVSAVSVGGETDRILGGSDTGPGLGYWLRASYGRGPLAVAAGVELSALSIGDGEALNSLAMPFELHVRPGRIGSVRPALVLGYVRYGIGHREVPRERLPADIATADTHSVGFIGNAVRVGAAVELPLSHRLSLEARPVADFIRFDQITLRDEGDADLSDGGSTRRLGLSIGVAWSF